jgi:hypothetical protein
MNLSSDLSDRIHLIHPTDETDHNSRLNLIIKCWSVIKLTQVLSYYLKMIKRETS